MVVRILINRTKHNMEDRLRLQSPRGATRPQDIRKRILLNAAAAMLSALNLSVIMSFLCVGHLARHYVAGSFRSGDWDACNRLRGHLVRTRRTDVMRDPLVIIAPR